MRTYLELKATLKKSENEQKNLKIKVILQLFHIKDSCQNKKNQITFFVKIIDLPNFLHR